MEDCTPRPRLYRRLNEYCRSDVYPFHMPGHKRRSDTAFMAEFGNPYGIDITEIDGFDNLHHAEGILRESMDWAASQYGAGRTYYLVNGSTCGVLAAVCTAVPRGGTILMARNCHKSAYHAAALNQLQVRYIYPQILRGFGLQGGLLPQDVEKMLMSENDCPPDAVFITSPTYEGVVSDVRGIAEVCRRYGVPLIVDEAHGAHFPFGEMFPSSALETGADLVIQSLHKTLPAFTQTALLHVRAGAGGCSSNLKQANGGFIDRDRLEYYLQVFQTSSPSYVLMAGIERCVEYMSGEGRREMERFAGRLAGLRGRLRQMKHLRLLDRDVIGQAGVYDLDSAKVVISARDAGIRGSALAGILRRDYHLETEMCGADYVTAITTLMDSDEGFERLERALLEIDEELEVDEKREVGGKLEMPAEVAVNFPMPGRQTPDHDARELCLGQQDVFCGMWDAGAAAPASQDAASAPQDAASMLQGGTPTPQDAASMLQGGTPAPQDTAPMLQGATPAPQDAVSMFQGATPAPQDAASMLQGATSGSQDAASVLQGAAPVSQAATPVLQDSVAPASQAVIPIHDVQSRPVRAVPLESASGRVCAEYVYLYPPGMPIVVPGELLTEEIIRAIGAWRAQRLPIQGMCDRTASTIRVLDGNV